MTYTPGVRPTLRCGFLKRYQSARRYVAGQQRRLAAASNRSGIRPSGRGMGLTLDLDREGFQGLTECGLQPGLNLGPRGGAEYNRRIARNTPPQGQQSAACDQAELAQPPVGGSPRRRRSGGLGSSPNDTWVGPGRGSEVSDALKNVIHDRVEVGE